ncbi:head decoration protein [uncultured Brevundimonas sp.]|uniref:head decoration protein n=1 Tax=uncultured Brevundimonas sp. TaxID=213418 RepID=UPI0025D6644E|nr:head decoration protein [uncultured Brevundimonas sp.]
MTILKDTARTGGFILTEATGYRSRDTIQVAPNQTLPVAAVLGQITTSKQYVRLAPAATDGSQNAAGVLFDAVTTGAAPAEAVSISRDAEVVLADLSWPAGITDNQKATAVAALAAKGVIARV